MASSKHKGASRETVFLGKFKKKNTEITVLSRMFPKSREKLGFQRASDAQSKGKKGVELYGSKGDAHMTILYPVPSGKKSRLSVSVPVPAWLSVEDQKKIARRAKGAIAFVSTGGRTRAV